MGSRGPRVAGWCLVPRPWPQRARGSLLAADARRGCAEGGIQL